MKLSLLISIPVIAISLFIWHKSIAEKARNEIVFIGDSITFGSTLKDPQRNSYPAIIQQNLKKTASVHNLGVPGAMISLTHPFSFCKTKEFLKLQQLKPDLAFIMLGTNDSTLSKGELKLDYSFEYLSSELKKINPRVKIIYIMPPEIKGTQIFHKNDFLEEEIIPILSRLCKKNNIKTISLKKIIDNSCYAPDLLHINKKGHLLIADKIVPIIRDLI